MHTQLSISELINILNKYMDQQVADNVWDLVTCLEITLKERGDIQVSETLDDMKALWIKK